MDSWNRQSRPDHADLLQSARTRDLQARSLAELRALAADLATACEAARVAAIRNILQATPDPNHVYGDQAQCGFTSLYTALRRVRAEVKRKETHDSRRMPSAPARSDALPRSNLRARTLAQVSSHKRS